MKTNFTLNQQFKRAWYDRTETFDNALDDLMVFMGCYFV